MIEWLRSPEGERWSREEYIGPHGRISRHYSGNGVFGCMIPDVPGTEWNKATARMCPDGGDIAL